MTSRTEAADDRGANDYAARRTRERPRRSDERGCSGPVRDEGTGRRGVVEHHTDCYSSPPDFGSDTRLAGLRGQDRREAPLGGRHGSRVQNQVSTSRIAPYRLTSVWHMPLRVRSLVHIGAE